MRVRPTTKYMITGLNARHFDGLTESQMEFKGANWEVQEDRFDQPMNFNHQYIYWVESYAALVLATNYLEVEGYSFVYAYDDAVEMYCFTTDYPSNWTN